MRAQHLSDEAIAAFADDVLSGHARERARRHTASCAECNHAVAVQREAVWALRSAPAPALPSGLLDRLRGVPESNPINRVPTVVDERGTTMFATFAAPAAAFVAQSTPKPRPRHARPFAMTAASVAVLGALAGSAIAADSGHDEPSAVQPARVEAPAGAGPQRAYPAPAGVQLVQAMLPGHAR